MMRHVYSWHYGLRTLPKGILIGLD